MVGGQEATPFTFATGVESGGLAAASSVPGWGEQALQRLSVRGWGYGQGGGHPGSSGMCWPEATGPPAALASHRRSPCHSISLVSRAKSVTEKPKEAGWQSAPVSRQKPTASPKAYSILATENSFQRVWDF